MAIPAVGILNLSNELLRDILDFIEADPDKLVSLDRRAYLSQESFKLPPQPAPDQAQVISNFRLVCKRFSELGSIHQFARLATRFSHAGFERLRNIASQEHLARHVKKFSYMVPYFYFQSPVDRTRDRQLELQRTLGASEASNFLRKVAEQTEIVRSGEDVLSLKAALSAFTSLQHVQILRVQDRFDANILHYARLHRDRPELLELKWAPACSHSTKTLGLAMLESKSPCSRFSSPMLSPQSAEFLAANIPRSFQSLASRLTSLELHFDEGHELDRKMAELSGLFRKIFTSAHNMQAIHIGFPTHSPLSLPLEDIFHNIKWERLAAFGIQAWKLDADEICQLVGRHKERLRGLRLRDVLLKDGSQWKDVLGYLRAECLRLDWVSLRRIGYEKHFDERARLGGAEILDDPLSNSESDSDDQMLSDSESGSSAGLEGDASIHSGDGLENHSHESDGDSHSAHSSDEDASEQLDDDDDDDFDDDDSEQGPAANLMEFPTAALGPSPTTTLPPCTCVEGERSFPDSPDDLGDNGLYVTNLQRKAWEKWVVRHYVCFQHGTDRSSTGRSS